MDDVKCRQGEMAEWSIAQAGNIALRNTHFKTL